jgi:hypothetical protein
MPLRNGKQYLQDYLCRKCTRFYGAEQYNYNCSYCIDGKHGLPTQRVFMEECDKWATEHSLKKTDLWYRHLQKASKLKKDEILYGFIRAMKRTNSSKYLLAEDALILYRDNPSLIRAHLLGHIVSDWWNIVSRDDKWPSHTACYYGNFNELPEITNNVPPRLPNGLMIRYP